MPRNDIGVNEKEEMKTIAQVLAGTKANYDTHFSSPWS